MIKLLKISIDEKRIYGLDILRALAILFVVVGHGGYLLPKSARTFINLFILDGVAIFFVLSGFLIGGILIKVIEEKGLNFKVISNFWVRRWFRTLPNYFLILITLTILNYLFRDGFTIRSINRYFYFSQNLYTEHPTWFFPEAWSLSVEEWFYILTPIALFFLTIVGKISIKNSVLISVICILFIVTGFRFYRFLSIEIENIGQWDVLFRKQVITRLDSLMYGVLGAYLSFYHYGLWIKRKTQLFFLGLIMIFSYTYVMPIYFTMDSLYYCVFSFCLMSLGTLFLLPYLSEIKRGSGFVYKILTYTSLISYSMYLLNLSLLQIWIINNISWENLSGNSHIIGGLKYFLYYLLLIIFSILLYKFYEIPMTRIREKIKF
jgi:peptidoglycan/LPS O-acetylase OafA/YrhL